MQAKWRTGLSGASNRERLVILYCERNAKQLCTQQWYEQRCTQFGSLICDATDLHVHTCKVTWSRYRGDLLLILRCFARDPRRICTYRWRVNVPATIGKAFDSIVTKGVEER